MRQAGFRAGLELFRASRRFSLLQTLCARRYEKRTQQAELVGKQKQIHTELDGTDTNEVARRFGELIPAPLEPEFCDLSVKNGWVV